MDPDELLGAAEVGALISRSTRTVQRLADTGELPTATKLRGRTGAYLFRRSDVDAYLERCQAEVTR